MKKYLCDFLTTLYAHFQNQIERATCFTGSTWNLLWKLTTLMTTLILLCSIKLLTYKYLMQTYLFLSRSATFRRHFGITKEEQGLYTTLQGLAYLGIWCWLMLDVLFSLQDEGCNDRNSCKKWTCTIIARSVSFPGSLFVFLHIWSSKMSCMWASSYLEVVIRWRGVAVHIHFSIDFSHQIV